MNGVTDVRSDSAETPVTLGRRIEVVHPRGFSRFRFCVSLTAEHPDMGSVSIYTGDVHFQVYPEPGQAREMAGMLNDLADAIERAQLQAVQP